jgi:arsenate reductase (glutaredoxin)
MDIYFNPACDNCKTVKAILEERGVDARYIAYLEQAPSREEIERVMGLLSPEDRREMVRAKEPVYSELGLDSAGVDQLLDAMAAHPILIQRPIVIQGDRAVIARPGERVLELLEADRPAGA